MTLGTIAALLVALYVVHTLAYVTAYWLTERMDQWRNDRRWRHERAAMDASHAKARGKQ
jgi:hypothetical protein